MKNGGPATPPEERNTAGDGAPRPSLGVKIRERFRIPRFPGAPGLNFTLVRQLWEIVSPYWYQPGSAKKWLAFGLYLVQLFTGTLVGIKAAVFAGEQIRALGQHNAHTFYRATAWLIAAQLAVQLFTAVFSTPYRVVLIYWGRWITRSAITAYLRPDNYYSLYRDSAMDNPDERVANDVDDCVELTRTLMTGLPEAFSSIAGFSYILWSFGWYLLPACCVASAISFMAYALANRPVLKLDYATRRLEGDFRFALVRARRQAEPIAFLRGEEAEETELKWRFAAAIGNARNVVYWNAVVDVALGGSNNALNEVPSALAGPLVLRGSLDLNGYSQALNAWGQVEDALTYFAGEADNFATWGAAVARVHALIKYSGARSGAAGEPAGAIKIQRGRPLAVENLTIAVPGDGRTLVQGLSFDTKVDGAILVTGGTGAGKTSLLRGLAGLWSHGAGTISIPERDKVLFLPQAPYMCPGSLRQQMIYPAMESPLGDAELRHILEAVSLGYLEERGGWQGEYDWTRVLSPGEQQRLMFTRALVHRPQLLILDESTEALDQEDEQTLYELVKSLSCSYLSVSHRASLIPFHDSLLNIMPDGSWTLSRLRPRAAADSALS